MSEEKKTTKKKKTEESVEKKSTVKKTSIEKTKPIKEATSTGEKAVEIKISDFKGKFISAIGRRKTSTARIRLFQDGKGAIIVNGLKFSKYFSADKISIVNQPLKASGHMRDVDISVVVVGGGMTGQAEAVRHGISRALIEMDPELRVTLKARGWLKRDDRKVERKKPGLKKARKRPQWSKR